MGKYGGLPGDYSYRLKEHAKKAQVAAKKKGYKTKLAGSRGHWTLVVYKK